MRTGGTIAWRATMRLWLQAAAVYKWWGIGVVVLIMLANTVEAFLPWTLKYVFDALAHESTSWSAVWPMLLLFGGGRFVVNMGWTYAGLLTDRFQPRTIAVMEQRALAYLLGHAPQYFQGQFAGSLVKRIGRFGRAFERVCDEVFFSAIPITVFIVVGAGNLFSRSLWLGGGYIAWVIGVLVFNLLLLRWVVRFDAARDAMDSRVGGLLADLFSNIATVRAFAMEKGEWRRYTRLTNTFARMQARSWDRHQLIRSGQETGAMILDVGSLSIGVWLWSRGHMSVGDVVFTQMIMSQITSRVRDIGRALRGVSEAFSNASETVEILRTPQGILDRPGAKPLRVTQAEIVFEAVRFAYHAKQTNHRVLSQVSCRIAPGEKVAFVGPSGAGKSTVMKLLMRDWEVVKGDIRIDGQSIAHITQESLRRAIGLVPQDPSLFHRSVADNIRIGRPSASLQEVEAAARSAHAHEFIMRLPDGYNTFVGERGVKLSGGERQRIAIARAMLKNAPILLLDEATSALDSESEALIQESLFSLMEGKTVLVIAHRLSTVMHMDRIFVLEGGKIVDQGTHTNLVSRPGVYQDLWSIQAGGFLGE